MCGLLTAVLADAVLFRSCKRTNKYRQRINDRKCVIPKLLWEPPTPPPHADSHHHLSKLFSVFRNLEVFLVFVLIEDRSGENSDGR